MKNWTCNTCPWTLRLSLSLLTLCVGTAFAQAPPGNKPPQAKTIQQQDIAVTVVPGGMQRHVPDEWTTLSVNGLNRTDQDSEELVTVWLGPDSNHQFARKFWVPAKSRRQAWMPALMPPAAGENATTITSIRLKESADGEDFQSNVIGEPQSSRRLLISREDSRCVVMIHDHRDNVGSFVDRQDFLRNLYACRDTSVSDEHDLGIVTYSSRFLPPGPNSLDPIDQIVIGGDRLLHDTKASERLMQWVRNGGKLWVMLDRIDQEYTAQLLGDEACFTELDRIEVNSLELQRIDPLTGNVAAASSWSSDHPIDMVRVQTNAEAISCKVDGWPAVFVNPVGQGDILFTTVHLSALVKDGIPAQAFRNASNNFFVRKAKPTRYASKMETFVSKEIGYSIPGRSLIGLILGVQIVIVLAAGIFLALSKRLHLLSILIPVSAGLASILLLVIGRQNTSAVASTVSVGQFAQVTDNGSRMLLDSTTAIYSQDGEDLNIVASPSTNMMLGKDAATSEMKRMVWSDDGKSTLSNFRQPPGAVRHITSVSSVDLSDPIMAQGKFTERGFECELSGLQPGQCEDVIVFSDSTPALALKPDEQSTNDDAPKFVGQPMDVLPTDQFIQSSVVSDRQRDRQNMLRELALPQEPVFGQTPRLLAWTTPLSGSLSIDGDFQTRGSALMSIPIGFQNGTPGQSFVVPANFVRLQLSSAGGGFSSLFNPQTGQWLQDLTKPNSAKLSCVVPSSLRPCKLTSAQLQIKLSAPSRTLEIKTRVDGEYVSAFRKDNPNGLIVVDLDKPEQLQINDGTLELQLAISPTQAEREAGVGGGSFVVNEQMPSSGVITAAKPGSGSVWSIEFLRVSVGGTIQ